MTVTDQLKIIDNKIKANQAQYDLDRLAAKISSYSSDDLRKYEYLTGQDLGYKPSVIDKGKFEYSPLGKIFNDVLKEENKKEVLLKRVKNIGDKSEELLKVLKDHSEKQTIINKVKNPNFNNVSFRSLLDANSMKVFNEIKEQGETVDYSRLDFVGSSKKYTS